MTALLSEHHSSIREERSKRLQRWNELCERYLPIVQDSSIWRYHRRPRPGDAEKGWKLHVSATVLNAQVVLERIGPFLEAKAVQFKAPVSLEEVHRLNSGLDYSYTQIGKVITVYPASDAEAVALARRLHELTRGLSAPNVPFDLRYKARSNVYYRYGAFKWLEMNLPNGARVPAMKDPEGVLVPDVYEVENAAPSWARNPFPIRRKRTSNVTPLKSTFRVFRALSQRGKGGVYQAVDLSVHPPRLCLIKEGRKAGELSWDGRDGRWRVKHEKRVLEALRDLGVDVPRVYSSFEAGGNYYLVTEFIAGESLQSYLYRKKRRIPVARALQYAIELCKFISEIHVAGWVWRDCKPTNIILTSGGKIRSLDFEGACQIDQPEAIAWVTPSFARPVSPAGSRPKTLVDDDVFAVGTILYLLLTGRLPESNPDSAKIRKLRPNTPPEVAEFVSELLNPDATNLPGAHEAGNQLAEFLAHLQNGKSKDTSYVDGIGIGKFRRCTSDTYLESEWRAAKIGSTVT